MVAAEPKKMTRQDIANLIIETVEQLQTITWRFRMLANEEIKRRRDAVRKLGFDPDRQGLRVT